VPQKPCRHAAHVSAKKLKDLIVRAHADAAARGYTCSCAFNARRRRKKSFFFFFFFSLSHIYSISSHSLRSFPSFSVSRDRQRQFSLDVSDVRPRGLWPVTALSLSPFSLSLNVRQCCNHTLRLRLSTKL
jgi:hypothetical protein